MWIVVMVAVAVWFAGRDSGEPPPRPAASAERPPTPRTEGAPPGGPTRSAAAKEREEERFAEGAVFGYLAYQHWVADDQPEPDGLFAGEEAGGLEDDPWADDPWADDPADGGWDDFDDGFGL